MREPHIKSLSPGYELEIGRLSCQEWTRLSSGFGDASIYQSWTYGAVRWTPSRLEHAVLTRNGQVAGLAQVITVRIPVLGCGVAYIPSGPLWRRGEPANDSECMRQMGRGLINEFVHSRGLFLRMAPAELDFGDDHLRPVFEEEGFRWSQGIYRTLLLDLSPSLDDLRKGLGQKWRNQLNRSERNGLKITDSSDTADFDRFLKLYRQMVQRKNFRQSLSVDQFRTVQEDLPSSLKMRVFLCESEGEIVAGAVCSAIGDTGIYLLGATNERGMTSKGSYLLQWQIIRWLKERKLRYYDLGGIDRASNPGVYHFKAGISEKEIQQIGTFEACTSLKSLFIVKTRDKWLSATR